jgi:very-short-patch-repair endonuclease
MLIMSEFYNEPVKNRYLDEVENEGSRITYWFIDITFPEKKLAVEIDGDYWHSLPKQIQKDANKDHWLIRHHWKILRLKEHEIKANVNSCADRIEALLK